jgi:hypothetical protein
LVIFIGNFIKYHWYLLQCELMWYVPPKFRWLPLKFSTPPCFVPGMRQAIARNLKESQNTLAPRSKTSRLIWLTCGNHG